MRLVVSRELVRSLDCAEHCWADQNLDKDNPEDCPSAADCDMGGCSAEAAEAVRAFFDGGCQEDNPEGEPEDEHAACCDPSYCSTCAAFAYCLTAPDENCANAPTDCATSGERLASRWTTAAARGASRSRWAGPRSR